MKKRFLLLFAVLFYIGSCSQQTVSYNLRKDRVAEIKEFVKNSKYNDNLAIFIDFKIPFGKFRFFIYDLKNDRILQRGIVSHGSGSVVAGTNILKFSNVDGSYQSSLGKYEIGASYVGKFGKAYKLYGLDSTNSNAFSRTIVLHSYPCIKNSESPEPACLSLGCPMLSAEFFKTTAKYLDSSQKPIIMYAFY